MGGFAWALAAFVAIHVGVSATGLRARLVQAIGEWPYRAVFSLVSLGLLIWLIQGYGAVRADPFDQLNEPMWLPPSWLRWPAIVLGLFGIALAVTGILTRGPTSMGAEKSGLARSEPAHGVLRITRHPFLWGVAFWGVAHLMTNGERVAVMLFGALAAMVIFGARSIDRKGAARDPEGWERFAAVSSNAPFAAIVQGRNRLVLSEIGWRGLVGIVAAFAIAWGHGQVGPDVF